MTLPATPTHGLGGEPAQLPAEPGEPAGPVQVLAELVTRVAAARRYDIGFPGATDLTFPALADVLTGHLLNNVGDPYDAGHGLTHTKTIEQQVIDTVADLLRAPPGRWGYVSTGSSEAILHALDDAWQQYPDLVVYVSTAGHYAIAKAARLLKLPLVLIRTDDTGRIDLDDLYGELGRRRHLPAAIVATAGTTMTEAVDDVAAITAVCDDLAITRRRIHVDAALAGIPLALLDDADRPAFDFTAGATSMSISGHKFLSTLMPCGVLIYNRPPHHPGNGRVAYIGAADTTITGSRSGHTPLLLWWALTTLGRNGLHQRAQASRDLAAYTHDRLRRLGWPTGRNAHAFTVTLDHPPDVVTAKWALASDGGTAHIVCMPGMTREQIDEFIEDLKASRDVARPTAARRRLPRPRVPPPPVALPTS